MTLTERLTRALAPHSLVDGAPALLTHGHPVLVEAFAALGWSDPHVDTADPPDDGSGEDAQPTPDLGIFAFNSEEG